MKVKSKKKADRHRMMRKGEKCRECGESVENGYHFVPALHLWSCTGRYQRPLTAEDIFRGIFSQKEPTQNADDSRLPESETD